MLTRILAAAAFATLSIAAQAGTLQGTTWTPSSACANPGDAPTISDKSPEAYNKSGKVLQAWQATAQTYANCVQTEAKADQNSVVAGANETITKLSDQMKAVSSANDAAIAKLKTSSKKSQ
jgi:hypothetical protein